MITRKLVIGDPVAGAGAAGLVFRGDGNFGSNFGEDAGYIPVSRKSVIVWAGPANQPMLEIFNSIFLAFRDLAFWGPPARNAPLETYLTQHYHLMGSFGEYQVFGRD